MVEVKFTHSEAIELDQMLSRSHERTADKNRRVLLSSMIAKLYRAMNTKKKKSKK